MSGGRFNYEDSNLKHNIFGWSVDYGDPVPNIFEDRELSELIYDVFELIHDYDWYASGDTGEDTWLREKGEFKEKWLASDNADRCKRIVDRAIKELKSELYKTWGLEE